MPNDFKLGGQKYLNFYKVLALPHHHRSFVSPSDSNIQDLYSYFQQNPFICYIPIFTMHFSNSLALLMAGLATASPIVITVRGNQIR